MGITNYRIDKVDAEVKKRGAENIDVKNGFSIMDVTKKNAQMLDIKWGFSVDYKTIGKMEIEGMLTYFTDKIADKYEEKDVKGKKMMALKGDALREVSNFILRRGIIEAVILAKTLQLPAPIQLPSVKVEEKKA
jgi:hypothetical protein